MHFIIWWFLSLFCRHTWKYEETVAVHVTKDQWRDKTVAKETIPIVSATCTKCGWHHSYRKFGNQY